MNLLITFLPPFADMDFGILVFILTKPGAKRCKHVLIKLGKIYNRMIYVLN